MNSIRYFYKGSVDDDYVEVEIIQNIKGVRFEIIRKSRIGNRKNYAGFWVNVDQIIVREGNG